MLKIKANWSEVDLRKYIDQEIEAYLGSVVETYIKAGKAMVDDARGRTKDASKSSFGNITWELRNSIGCVVYRGSKKALGYFPVLSTGAQGSKDGEAYADLIASEYTNATDIVLIVVAGKEYAAAVQSKGYNVIEATALGAEKILERFINEN